MCTTYQAYLYRTKITSSGTNFKTFDSKQHHRLLNTWSRFLWREAKRRSTSVVLLDFMPSNKFWYKFPTNFYIWSFDWVPFVRTHWLLLTKNDWNPHKHTYLLDNLRSLWFIVWHRQILISIPLLGCFFGLELANG